MVFSEALEGGTGLLTGRIFCRGENRSGKASDDFYTLMQQEAQDIRLLLIKGRKSFDSKQQTIL